MKTVNNKNLLKKYIELYNINELFLNDMQKHMSLYIFKKGEYIFSSGEEMLFFCFLVNGKVKIVLNLENGKSFLINYSDPLDILGNMETVEHPYSKYDIIAIEDTTVITLNIKIFSDLVSNDPLFLKYLYNFTLNKLNSKIKSNIILATYNLEHILANYFLSNIVEQNSKLFIEINSYSDLAQFLGTSYRHLNRVINKFTEQKLIKKENKKIIILNYEKLSGYFIELY